MTDRADKTLLKNPSKMDEQNANLYITLKRANNFLFGGVLKQFVDKESKRNNSINKENEDESR